MQIWLDCYNHLNSVTYRVDSYPDEDDRTVEGIDALCKDAAGNTLGLEHTRIEAFPGEMKDNARFMEVLGRLEKSPQLAEPGFQTTASIAVESIPTGIVWKDLSQNLETFLKANFPGHGEGERIVNFSQGKVSIPIKISKMRVPGSAGTFLVARQWPGKNNEITVQKAFDSKLPKLKASAAQQKILLVEQNSVAGSVSSDVATFLSQNKPAWMPDEVWLLWTGALETEQYVHVAQLYPHLQAIKANWKDGKVS